MKYLKLILFASVLFLNGCESRLDIWKAINKKIINNKSINENIKICDEILSGDKAITDEIIQEFSKDVKLIYAEDGTIHHYVHYLVKSNDIYTMQKIDIKLREFIFYAAAKRLDIYRYEFIRRAETVSENPELYRKNMDRSVEVWKILEKYKNHSSIYVRQYVIFYYKTDYRPFNDYAKKINTDMLNDSYELIRYHAKKYLSEI